MATGNNRDDDYTLPETNISPKPRDSSDDEFPIISFSYRWYIYIYTYIYVSSMEGNELVAGFDTINGKISAFNSG